MCRGRAYARDASVPSQRRFCGRPELAAQAQEVVCSLVVKSDHERPDVRAAVEAAPTVRVLLRQSTDRLDALGRERFALLGAFAPKPATFDVQALGSVWETADPRPTI